MRFCFGSASSVRAESKTIAQRTIRVRVSRKETQDLDHGTTFWLAADEDEARGLPFGWALLEPAEAHGRAADLLEGFRQHAPWSALRLDAPVVARPPEAKALAPASAEPEPEEAWQIMIKDLQTKLERGQLGEDYLKNAVSQAARFAQPEHRAALREWIAGHYKQVIRQAFRQKNFETVLARLK